jgi:uncharacterized protein (TIGR01777 family)
VGRNGGFLSRLLPLFKLGLGGRLGDGRQWMSWIHLEDHVAMMIRLLNEPEWSGPFNATGPEPVTNGDFTDQLASILRRPALLPVPAFALRLVLGELSELLLGGQRALPARLQEYGFKFRFPSLEAALVGAVSRAP